MLQNAGLVRTDVSEEGVAFIFTTEKNVIKER
jgi:hypothetical protein